MTLRLHLVQLELDARRLAALPGLGRNERQDRDYAVHAGLLALFDEGALAQERVAPKPFATTQANTQALTVLGYSALDASALAERVERFSSPAATGILRAGTLVSKPVPELRTGTRIGFRLRACPTKRVSRFSGHPSVEIDAFLAAVSAKQGDDAGDLSREAIYIDWLGSCLTRLGGCSLERATVTAMKLDRFIRKTQGKERTSKRLQRPDVTFEVEATIGDAGAFRALLARGIGRHRSFGFGMVLLRPPRAGSAGRGEG